MIRTLVAIAHVTASPLLSSKKQQWVRKRARSIMIFYRLGTSAKTRRVAVAAANEDWRDLNYPTERTHHHHT